MPLTNTPDQSSENTSPSRGKIVLFSLAPALLLILALAVLEAALRLFAPSLSPPLYRQIAVDGERKIQINRRYLERFFSWDAAMIPELAPAEISDLKDSTILRIVCLGESSMFGTPYAVSATPSALLSKQLRHLFPDRTIEVVNLGASAINTNVIVTMVPGVIRLNPDLVLIYTGHNEFYGPGGVGAPWLIRKLPVLSGAAAIIRDLPLTALIRSLLPSTQQAAGNERNMMKTASRGAEVALNSGDARFVFRQFESNFRHILVALRDARIPVLVSDLTSNLNFPPLGAGRDSSEARVEFASGLSAYARGDSVAALQWFTEARDHDLLKFRAPAETNRIIHRVSLEESIPCLPADSLFRAASPRGITDTTLFTEHLHPNVRGYDLLARLFLNAARGRGYLPFSADRPLLPFDPDSLALCWLDLAGAEISLQHLTGGWPFGGFHVSTPLLDRADSTRRALVVALMSRQTGWHDAERVLARHAVATRDTAEAIRTYRTIVDDSPRDLQSLFSLGQLYAKTGSEERALSCYRTLLTRDSSFVPALVEAGLLETNAGDFSGARRHFTRALDLTASSPDQTLRGLALYGLGAVEANEGDERKAGEHLAEASRILPGFQPALQLSRQLAR
jgi:tetratricopeptide (TPR) repeat protein